MASAKTKRQKGRRDRRKAKQSGYRREGTCNAKKVAHHANMDGPNALSVMSRNLKHL